MMKFGKRLHSHLQETLPTWRDKYLSYKHLKKTLVATNSSPSSCSYSSASASPAFHGAVSSSRFRSNEENGDVLNPNCGDSCEFVDFLNLELDKLNAFFVDKEEEYVIRLQELKERCETIRKKCGKGMPLVSQGNLNEEMMNITRDIVNFHGEMVLLENYSSLNYIGLVKILKKHDKRTGIHLRMPYINNVLHQPFFTTELLSRLVHECEMNLQLLVSIHSTISTSEPTLLRQPNIATDVDLIDDAKQKPEPEDDHKKANTTFPNPEDVNNIYSSTLAALRIMKEIRRRSSTYNIFSLPPLDDNI